MEEPQIEAIARLFDEGKEPEEVVRILGLPSVHTLWKRIQDGDKTVESWQEVRRLAGRTVESRVTRRRLVDKVAA